MIGIIFVIWYARREFIFFGYNIEYLYNIVFYTLIFGFLGARLYDVILK